MKKAVYPPIPRNEGAKREGAAGIRQARRSDRQRQASCGAARGASEADRRFQQAAQENEASIEVSMAHPWCSVREWQAGGCSSSTPIPINGREESIAERVQVHPMHGGSPPERAVKPCQDPPMQ